MVMLFVALLIVSSGCELAADRVFHILQPIVEEQLGIGDGPSNKGNDPPGNGHGKGGSKDTTGTTPPPPDSTICMDPLWP